MGDRAAAQRAVSVHLTGAAGPTAVYNGAPMEYLNLPASNFFRVHGRVQAIIDLQVTSFAPWKGGIRIEVGGPGEEGKHATIPVSVS